MASRASELGELYHYARWKRRSQVTTAFATPGSLAMLTAMRRASSLILSVIPDWGNPHLAFGRRRR
jgi:hypothetical protein